MASSSLGAARQAALENGLVGNPAADGARRRHRPRFSIELSGLGGGDDRLPADVVEMALAHAVSSKVEAAYRRGDLFEKRRRLMADWAAFCEGRARGESVLPLKRNA